MSIHAHNALQCAFTIPPVQIIAIFCYFSIPFTVCFNLFRIIRTTMPSIASLRAYLIIASKKFIQPNSVILFDILRAWCFIRICLTPFQTQTVYIKLLFKLLVRTSFNFLMRFSVIKRKIIYFLRHIARYRYDYS